MTIREFYNEVINANINEDMTNKASELIAALDARNDKRKSTESKEKKEAIAMQPQNNAMMLNPILRNPI